MPGLQDCLGLTAAPILITGVLGSNYYDHLTPKKTPMRHRLVSVTRWFSVAVLLAGAVACKPASNALAFGEYRGEKSGMTEVILLKKDGVFEHSAFRDGKRILHETGTYTFAATTDEVTFVNFTEVYDATMNAMGPPRSKFGSYPFTYFRYDAFAELKPDEERNFSLTKSLP